MKNIVPTSLCAAFVACVTTVMAAQTTSPPQASAPTTDQKTIVVTGCLKEVPSSSMPSPPAATGTTGTTGAAGAPPAAAPAPTYVLTDAAIGTAEATAAPAATGTTGTSGTTGTTGAVGTTGTAAASTAAPPASASQTYRLIANASALTPHVGKKLELTGTLEPAASGKSEPAAASDANANSPSLRVQSGKVVAASCTP